MPEVIVDERMLEVIGMAFDIDGARGGLSGIDVDKVGEIPEGFKLPLPQPFPICAIAGWALD